MKPVLTLHNPSIARSYYKKGLWKKETLYSLLELHARSRPEGYALRDSSRILSWQQLKCWVDGCADALTKMGVEAGDRVSLLLSNRVEGVITFLACARGGIVCNPSLHRNYTVAEILKLLKSVNASVLFAEESWGVDAETADVFESAKTLPSMKSVIRLPRRREPGEFPMPGTASPSDDDADKVIYLAFTSGTTGTPKGVLHSQNTLLANARGMVNDWGHDENSVLLSLSPLSHHIAWVGVAQSLYAGMELVLNDPPESMSQLDWIIKTGATYVMGVPTHAMDVLDEQASRNIPRIGNVSTFYMAGSPIPPATARAFLDQGICPQNVYGMTETSSHQYTLPSDDEATIVNTCGQNRPHYEVRLFNQENRNVEVAQGEIGEIGGKGACLMLGYFDNQRATENSFNRDGWFMSGDLGRFDENGCLEIVGRVKDMVIRGGHNIFPATIEIFAMKHPDVQKAAAFGVADERLGERVCLAVTCDNHDIKITDLLNFMADKGLSKFDMPEWFTILPEFPLTASGKILKRELVEMVARNEIIPQRIRYKSE